MTKIITRVERFHATLTDHAGAPCSDEEALVDLLTEALHYCREKRLDFEQLMASARANDRAERDGLVTKHVPLPDGSPDPNPTRDRTFILGGGT